MSTSNSETTTPTALDATNLFVLNDSTLPPPAILVHGDGVFLIEDFEQCGSVGPDEDSAQVSVYFCDDEDVEKPSSDEADAVASNLDDDDVIYMIEGVQEPEPSAPAMTISHPSMLIGIENVSTSASISVTIPPHPEDSIDGDGNKPLPNHKGVEEKSDEGLSCVQKAYLIALIAATTISGVGHTWTLKWQNLMDVEVKSDGTTQAFTFPLFQSWFQFLGMSLWLLIYRVQLLRKAQRGEELVVGDDLPTRSLKFYHFIPLGLAQIGSTLLQCYGLSLTDPSTYAMIRGSDVIHSVWISIFLLKKRFRPFEWTAVGTIALGLLLVFLAGTVGDGKKDPKPGMPSMEMQMLGNVLVLLATICSAAVAALHEKMMKRFSAPVTLLVGGGSLVAGVILTIAIAVLQAVPIDDIRLFAYAFAHDWRCGVSSFLLGFCLFVFYYAAGQITRLASAVVIMMLGNLRIFTVWMISLALHSVTNEKFSFMQAAGFVVIVTGTMIYKNFIPLPFAWCYRRSDNIDGGDDASVADSNLTSGDDNDIIFVPKDWLSSNDIGAIIEANKHMPPADRLPKAALACLLSVWEKKVHLSEHNTNESVDISMTSVRLDRSRRSSIISNPLASRSVLVNVADEVPKDETKERPPTKVAKRRVVETVQMSRRLIRAAIDVTKHSHRAENDGDEGVVGAGLQHAVRLRAAAAINTVGQ